MNSTPRTKSLAFALILLATLAFALQPVAVPAAANGEPTVALIVQGTDPVALDRAVERLGGRVTHDLAIIDALGVEIRAGRVDELRRHEAVSALHVDAGVGVAGGNGGGNGGGNSKGQTPYTEYPRLLDAPTLHQQGIEGSGVTVAVLDTGIWEQHPGLKLGSDGHSRILAQYDALTNREGRANDENGHGSHVTSVIVNSETVEENGQQLANGIAPNADVVVVKAFDGEGRGTYSSVIRGLGWILSRQDDYGIRVVNLSFSAPVRSHYWEDPLNQAVMRLWQAGIVVVTSAGNTGPDPLTIGVPGNIPYVITVGAMSDARTPQDESDDFVTTFSSAGPTFDAFIKPEVVAPGGHVLGLMDRRAHFPQNYPDFYDGDNYFEMSGTSQSSAAVSAVAALLLQAEPTLSPDDVKCRLMATARTAIDESGTLAYSVFRHGAGMIDADAVFTTTGIGCANLGLDIDKDLADLEHYVGPTQIDDNGNFFVEGVGYPWDGTTPAGGFFWIDANPWINPDANPWINPDTWNDGSPFITANPWINPDANPWINPDANPWINPDANPWINPDANPWINPDANPWINPDAAMGLEVMINLWVDQE